MCSNVHWFGPHMLQDGWAGCHDNASLEMIAKYCLTDHFMLQLCNIYMTCRLSSHDTNWFQCAFLYTT